MGLSTKKIHGKEFLYYQEHGKSILIGPKGKYDKGNLENTEYAMKNNDSRITKLLKKYVEETVELSFYRPQPERNEYLSKRTAELVGILRLLEQSQAMTVTNPNFKFGTEMNKKEQEKTIKDALSILNKVVNNIG